MNVPHLPRRLFVTAILLALSLGPAAAAVDVALLPASSNIPPGGEIVLEITVTDPGSDFNAFDATVTYDTSLLTLISSSEGPLMTSACVDRFDVVSPATGSVTVTNGLLCAGVSVNGPGTVYSFTFQATEDDLGFVETTVGLGASFFDEGTAVAPINSAGATVFIDPSVPTRPSSWGMLKARWNN